MKYSIYIAFSYSAKYKETPAVCAARILSENSASGTSAISTEIVLDIPRSGQEMEANKPLMEGLERILRAQNLQPEDEVHVHAYQQFLIDGLNGLMFAWHKNNWQKFYEAQEPAYRDSWEYLYGLATNGIKLNGHKESDRHKVIEPLKIAALARKNQIVAEAIGA